VIEPSARAAAFLRFFNPDGGEAGACGNGTRCAARLLMEGSGVRELRLETAAGLLAVAADGRGGYTVDMGAPRLDWRDVPLAEPADTLRLPLARGPLREPVALSMGNPHAVFFVDDVEAVDLARLGPELERDPLFPERANIGAAQVLAPDAIRLRVWERGAGLTPACGSGACAALVAAVRRGLTGRDATLRLDGGELRIAWSEGGSVLMTGPALYSFTGRTSAELLGRVSDEESPTSGACLDRSTATPASAR
jgi:diaminopimelate epimerase